jgi:hypothetical protein
MVKRKDVGAARLMQGEAVEIQSGLMWGARIYAAIAAVGHILALCLRHA